MPPLTLPRALLDVPRLPRALAFSVVLAAAALGCQTNQAPTDGGASEGPDASLAGDGGARALAPRTVFFVGDSTVAAFDDPYYYPRYGWGTQMGRYLSPALTLRNFALSGRSSKSFIDPQDNTQYAALVSSLRAGNFLLIGFGHNDEKADPALYTNPRGDVADPTSFKHSLATYYIDVARAVGALPVLVTPIVRRDASGAYGGAKVHVTADVTAGGTVFPGGDYPAAIRDLGASLGVPVVDATAATLALGKQLFASEGAAGTARLQAWVTSDVSSVDDTHTNVYGAASYAFLIARALATGGGGLAPYVLPQAAAPEASLLTPNPAWKPAVYAPPKKGSLWQTTEPWWGSVFGDIGSMDALTDGSYGISETSASPLTVRVRSGSATAPAGKIANNSDGMAFYFRQIPADRDFTLTATAKVEAITYSNSQVGFGVMVRDAVWMDTFDPSAVSAYVACGSLKGNTPASAWSSFTRSPAPTSQLAGTAVSAAGLVPGGGSSLTLTLVKEGDRYSCSYGTESAKAYTVSLNGVDPGFDYVGLFTARSADITFSDVSLALTP